MKFTPSKDGLPRASVRIDFRIGIDVLHVAAAELVWNDLIEETDPEAVEAAEDLANDLTKPQIVAKARDILKHHGYDLTSVAEEQYWDIAHEAAKPIIEEFWPVEVAAWREHAESQMPR